jgi:hypothetical protein
VPLTITCCHNRRPREAKIFHVLPIASGTGSITIFKSRSFSLLTNDFFEKTLMKSKEIAINEYFKNVCLEKNPFCSSVDHEVAKIPY